MKNNHKLIEDTDNNIKDYISLTFSIVLFIFGTLSLISIYFIHDFLNFNLSFISVLSSFTLLIVSYTSFSLSLFSFHQSKLPIIEIT